MKIHEAQKQVAEFMVAGGQLEERPKKALLPEESVMARRVSMLMEEAYELSDAWEAGDIVGVADAWADIFYVLLGGAEECGIDLQSVFATVVVANNRKIDWKSEPPRPFATREDGKILKPQGWVGPEGAIAVLLQTER